MKKRLTLAFLIFTVSTVAAQDMAAPTNKSVRAKVNYVQPYGKIDVEDLKMMTCEFEKDANAEVLLDQSLITSDRQIYQTRHWRMKIFNAAGKNAANFRIEYLSNLPVDQLSSVKAETFNLENGQIVITPLDKKSIYTEKIDNRRSAMVFAFPNVKAGSVIEVQYNFLVGGFPTWYFQSNYPTRYSETKVEFPSEATIRAIPYVKQPFFKQQGEGNDLIQLRALENVPSLPDEPFMSSRAQNLQRMEYTQVQVSTFSWQKIGEEYLKTPVFAQELDKILDDEQPIINKAKSISNINERISYIFNTVKERMAWTERTANISWYGVPTAWNKKTGNSGEINMMVYHLLKKSGIKSYPLLVSSKSWGVVKVANPTIWAFNNMAVFIPVDSTKNYVLDASDKYALFNEIPEDDLNQFGLKIDPQTNVHEMVFLERQDPVIRSAFLNAEIKDNGEMTGTADIASFGYNKINDTKSYKTKGEEKYLKALIGDRNDLKISSIKFENMDIDSLPLTQTLNFKQELSGSGDGYIYFNTDLFNLMGSNPFVKETRSSDIDFKYKRGYSVSGVYKLPDTYKASALPKNVNIATPDGNIVFKRIVSADSNTITIRFNVILKKPMYFTEDYPNIREFYKQMYTYINEPIVLKKG